ncbi:hypothetical protein GCM10023069_31180 [Shinella granuli]
MGKIVSLNRDSTHHAFELGACFAEIKALVPKRGFGRCLKVFTDYIVRSAWSYISIHTMSGSGPAAKFFSCTRSCRR